MNDYDLFESEMVEAGWSLAMWLRHEISPIEDEEKVPNEADYHQGYLNGWDDGREYRDEF